MFSKINIYWIKIGISVYIIYHNLFFKYLNMVKLKSQYYNIKNIS